MKTGDYRPGNFDSGFHGPVSMSEALVRSFNLPAVQVLEAYGPAFCRVCSATQGCAAYFDLAAQPNLSLILGGAERGWLILLLPTALLPATVKREGCAYSRDALVERPLLSPGSARIIRRILANEAQPLPDNSLPQVAPLAWKTGTSYGYRDARPLA